MGDISDNAKNSNLPKFGESVSAGSKALCGLTEAAAQVIYSIAGDYFNIQTIRDMKRNTTECDTTKWESSGKGTFTHIHTINSP